MSLSNLDKTTFEYFYLEKDKEVDFDDVITYWTTVQIYLYLYFIVNEEEELLFDLFVSFTSL